MARNPWEDKVNPVDTYELTVKWTKKDDIRHVAHVTVPYDRSGNKKLYIKVALTATWLRRVFADSAAFSIRRARDVANATEIMSDRKTVVAALSMIEELCRFHAHDSTSTRRFASACVAEARAPPEGFNFLEADDDGTMFAVSVGRSSGTKVHVYTGEGEGKHRVVVLGAESNVSTVTETIRLMYEKIASGASHEDARSWVIDTLSEVCAERPGDGSSCLDETELPPEEPAAEEKPSELAPKPAVTVLNPTRCRADEVDSWNDEKLRKAEAATYAAAAAAAVAASVPKIELKPLTSSLAKEDMQSTATKQNSSSHVTLAPPFVPSSHLACQPAMPVPHVFTCRACGTYPRRVAFLPCAHLALCIACSDHHIKTRAPCIVCGTGVVQRQVFFLE